MAEEHIKINPVPTKVKYSGNGVVREFPTGFAFFENDNIVVYHNGKIIKTGYSITGVGETDGGVVTFDVAPAEGDKIIILRKVAVERVTDFQEGGAFRAKNINDELDRQTAFCQQIQEEIERCVKVEVTDEQTPEELLAEVYNKLDSATDVAQDAIAAANEATIAAEQATTAVEEAKKQVIETQEYVDSAKIDISNTKDSAIQTITETATTAVSEINNTVSTSKQEINTTIDEAQMSLSDTITQATDDVKQAAVSAAEGVISDVETDLRNGLQPLVTDAEDWAKTSKIWATGEDAEVETVAPGEEEHSSRGYADLAMAIANTPEDVPVDASTLLALDVIRGPKGDSGEADFSGDVTFTGTFDVHSDSNHPLKVTGMAGTSASGFQIVDSNGLGDSDFEHYATGDRYGTRITNHNNTSDTSVSVDLYQSNAGKSVLDATAVDTVLVKDLQVDGADVVKTSGNQDINGKKTFTDTTYHTNNLIDSAPIISKDKGADTTQIPTGDIRRRAFRVVDNNGRILADFKSERKNDGTQSSSMLARNGITGAEVSGVISVGVRASGDVYTYAPTPATDSNSTQIATTAWVNSRMGGQGLFCTTTVSGTSWSREWKNSSGTRVWLEQGGYFANSGTNYSITKSVVTLIKAFSNTNYTFLRADKVVSGAAVAGAYNSTYNSKTTTTVTCPNDNVSILAGFDWYACGK